MKSIYKTKNSKQKVLKLYEQQLTKLGCKYQDVFLETSYGKTHVIETGNKKGKPLLVFHGGNSTTAYNLLLCKFLFADFHIYAVDTIGHPGKSAENSLSANGYDYGYWASEVITALGYDKMNCYGESFGGGILAKLMSVEPTKVMRSVLVVPAGIHNALPISSLKMMVPLIKYCLTKKDKYMKQTAMYMAITKEALDNDTMETIKNSFIHVKTKVGMPSNVSAKKMSKCQAPTLVLASELDCLFPAHKVLPRARKIIPNSSLYQLKNRGHIHSLTEKEQKMIIDFLMKK